MPPLTVAEAGPYVTHQLQQVGGGGPVGVHRPCVADRLGMVPGGLPRRPNTWASACLMAAYAGQLTLVDDSVAVTAATELQWAGAV